MKNKQTHKQTNSSTRPLSTTITALSHDGRGIATLSDGKTTFITGALPGETVIFQITKKHSRYNEGDVIEIITPSPERVAPICPHFGTCGGCSMQHAMIATQIELKQKTVLEQLKHFGRVEPESIIPPLSGHSTGYRRKARLGVFYDRNNKKLQVGFREKASSKLTDVQFCAVLDQRIGEYIPAIKNVIRTLSLFESIPQVEVAIGDEITALVFRHLKDLTAEDIKKLCDFGMAHQFDIYLQPNSPAPISKIWPKNSIDYLTYCLPAYQLNMQFNPLDFIQVNNEINLKMIELALTLLDPQPTDTILDLFCGLGNFTLPIARHAQHVVGIEGSQEMVERAKHNAALNKIINTEFHMSNLASIPATQPAWMKKQYNKILLDPPRTGAKEIIGVFPKFRADQIVYVSCNPATLARDAGELVHQQGYKLKKVGIINMFPHTSHIETIALFSQ